MLAQDDAPTSPAHLQTTSFNTLFRRNSVTTKVMTLFARYAGHVYLQEVVSPAIREMLSVSNVASCELDPTRLLPGQSVDANLKTLVELVSNVLDRLSDSTSVLPAAFREICGFLRVAVDTKFPGQGVAAIGGFMFLRFICPALVSPDAYNLIGSVAAGARRNLVLVAKTLQNVANMLPFGSKEAFMTPLNPFIEARIPEVRKLLERFSKVYAVERAPPLLASPKQGPALLRSVLAAAPASPTMPQQQQAALSSSSPSAPSSPQVGRSLRTSAPQLAPVVASVDYVAMGEEDKLATLQRLHLYLVSNLELFHMALLELPEGQTTLSRLTVALAQLGPPPEELPKRHLERRAGTQSGAKPSNRAAANAMDLKQLVQENAGKDSEEVVAAKVFYRFGTSKNGHPMLFYNPARWSRKMQDWSMLMYWMVQSAQALWTAPFELVIDLTGAKKDHYPDEAWCERLVRVLPPEVLRNCAALVVVNADALFKKFASSRWLTALVPPQLLDVVSFVSSPQDDWMRQYAANPKECGLLPNTLSMFVWTATWSDLELVAAVGSKGKRHLRLSRDFIQLAWPSKCLGQAVELVENVHISWVQDVLATTESPFELTILYHSDAGVERLCLRSRSSVLQIHSSIKAMQTRFTLTTPTVRTRVITTSDVPGTMLNLAFLNLGSPDPQTRTAGYNLLMAVCSYFHFSASAAQLLEASGLCVPKTNNKFVVRLSAGLAKEVPSITLEFILECLHGLEAVSFEAKHLCLAYLKPWLPNLRSYFVEADGDKPARLTGMITQFVQLSVSETQIRPTVLAKIWKPLGRMPASLELTLQVLFQHTLSSGCGADEVAVMADAIITMAAQSPQMVTGKLVQRLMSTLRATGTDAVDELSEHALFQELALVLRMLLMVSFDNLIEARHHLPEVVLACSLLFAHGDWLQRVTVHRLLLNLAHAAFLHQRDADTQDTALLMVLLEMDRPTAKVHFG